VTIALRSPLGPNKEFADHINAHGDGVRDVAFEVEDCEHVYKVATSRGAESIQAPIIIEDTNGLGSVVVATIKTYGDTRHSFIQRTNFKGIFLPNYQTVKPDVINSLLGEVKFNFIDHIVANHQSLESTVEYYQKILDFHKYWSIDDTMLHTEYSYFNLLKFKILKFSSYV
jgi:4-hydroxyphenylpyruvate dioxygenase